MSEMKIKEEGHKIEMTKLYQDMQKKGKFLFLIYWILRLHKKLTCIYNFFQ